MKRLLIILGLIAGAAFIEAPDDYIWKGFENGATIRIRESLYSSPPKPDRTFSDSVVSADPAHEVAVKKI